MSAFSCRCDGPAEQKTSQYNVSYAPCAHGPGPFLAVLFYKVNHCSYWVRFLPASGHNVFVHRSVSNVVLCVFLFKGALFNIYH